MRNIIAGLATLIVVGLMAFTASKGGAYHGGEHGKIIKDFGDTIKNAKSIDSATEKTDRQKEDDKLSALRNKAGNAGAFKVSHAYKSKCSSCHGVNGSGFQNGKPMMGPKLIGQSEEVIIKDLLDFKAGRKENVVMRGLLMTLSEDDLKALAKEIGEFPARAKAQRDSR